MIKDEDDLDYDKEDDTIDVYCGYNDFGSIYVQIPIDMLKKKLEELNYDQKD